MVNNFWRRIRCCIVTVDTKTSLLLDLSVRNRNELAIFPSADVIALVRGAVLCSTVLTPVATLAVLTRVVTVAHAHALWIRQLFVICRSNSVLENAPHRLPLWCR